MDEELIEEFKEEMTYDLNNVINSLKRNENINNDEFLFEASITKFALSSARPLILALDMMQVKSIQLIKNTYFTPPSTSDIPRLAGNKI